MRLALQLNHANIAPKMEKFNVSDVIEGLTHIRSHLC